MSFKLDQMWNKFHKYQHVKLRRPCCAGGGGGGGGGVTYYVFPQWRTLGSWSRWWALDAGCSRACRHPWAGRRGAGGTASHARVEASQHRGSAEPPCLREKTRANTQKAFQCSLETWPGSQSAARLSFTDRQTDRQWQLSHLVTRCTHHPPTHTFLFH